MAVSLIIGFLNPLGRGKDLVPEKYFKNGLHVHGSFAKNFDSSLLHGDASLVEKTVQSLPKPGPFRVWMSHGTKGIDSGYAPFQLIANRLMHEHGYDHHNFASKVYKRSGHNERSWAKYLDQPMRFWLEAATPLEPRS